MKFLDIPELARIHAFLDNLVVGDVVVRCNLEAYSCKLAGLDKKLSRSLEEDMAAGPDGGSPPRARGDAAAGSSPPGAGAGAAAPGEPAAQQQQQQPAPRRTLVYLILALNHIFPDHDFSLLRAHHFARAPPLPAVREAVDEALVDAARAWDAAPAAAGGAPLPAALWAALDGAADLAGCEAYSYAADLEGDPFAERGALWGFNFFFLNRRLKRLVFFACRGVARAAAELSETTGDARYNASGSAARGGGGTDSDSDSDGGGGGGYSDSGGGRAGRWRAASAGGAVASSFARGMDL